MYDDIECISDTYIVNKMLQQRDLLMDKVLFRILKNKSPTASRICEKLNHNAKNIVLLSEDELCELWQHVKTVLFEAKKLYTQCSNNDNDVKECNLMVKLIRAITAMTLETITRRLFIPNVLLQNVMLLHSVIFPNIDNEQVKDELSYLLENWWKLDMIWKEKVITNAIIYLVRNCKSSLVHVKRLYEIKSSVALLKSIENVAELLKLVQEKTVMSLEEGRILILHLFTLGEQYILGIHNNVRIALQNGENNSINEYADLYVAAWINATEKLKKFIVENCFQTLVFHCFRANRDSTGRSELGKNLLSFLTALHYNESQTARLMIHNQCQPLLWKHLKAPGSYVRCNAIEILFVTTSVHFTCTTKDMNNVYLQKCYKAITNLLHDSNADVCNVTIKGLFEMLVKYWNYVPKNVIHNWLNILLRYTRNSTNSEIRANIFIGLKKVLDKKRSHRLIKDFLPNFAQSIYDEDSAVLDALIKLLWHAQDHIGISFWNVVPLSYILDCLENTENTSSLRELIKLLWLRISLNNANCNKMIKELISMGKKNLNAIRRFCYYSDSVMDRDLSIKLIEISLSMVKGEMQCLPMPRKNYNKKARSNKESEEINECICNREEDADYKQMQIYIDIIATLLLANIDDLEKENAEKNILQVVANELPEFSKYFKETSVYESVLFLFSLIPPRVFLNHIEIVEMLVEQLCNPNTRDDILLTIVYVLMKWDKGDIILFALTNLFTKSLDTNPPSNQAPIDSDLFKVNEEGLELSLRILRHLLHIEYQSVLTNKYHRDLLQFWGHLHRLKYFIENELKTNCSMNSLKSKDLIVQLFKEYMSLISLLHKEDVFDTTYHFSEVLSWLQRVMIPHISRIDINDIETHSICIDLIKAAFDTANSLMKECNNTPKLCCNVVLLYCSSLTPESGAVFLNHAFDAIMILLDFSKIAYENKEPNLINIVVPNFVCATMITLTRYNKNVLATYTNNLKMLHELTQKYFSITKSIFNDQTMCLPYITIMFNVAISSISTEMTRVLQNATITEEDILITDFPYLAKKILKIILNTKRYQKLSIDVLTGAITNYTKIDMLSALVVIHGMLKSSDRKIVNKLKNITLASKVHNQKQSFDAPFDRSILDAMNIVIHAILK